MIKYKQASYRIFQADQRGINDLKNEFFNEARKFIYFRKGGWQGFPDSLKYASEYAQNNPGITLTPVASYQLSSSNVAALRAKYKIDIERAKHYFGNRKKDNKTVRAIYTRGSLSRAQRDAWAKLCGRNSAVTIAESQAGEFRYLVNEKRYAIFMRLSGNRLQGIIGGDSSMINNLRDIFDLEYLIALLGKRK